MQCSGRRRALELELPAGCESSCNGIGNDSDSDTDTDTEPTNQWMGGQFRRPIHRTQPFELPAGGHLHQHASIQLQSLLLLLLLLFDIAN